MQESILTDIDQDVKERINYLVYKNRLRKEPITMQDLAVAYKYAKMNITVMEESKTSVLELLLLERYHDRICENCGITKYTVPGRREGINAVRKTIHCPAHTLAGIMLRRQKNAKEHRGLYAPALL